MKILKNIFVPFVLAPSFSTTAMAADGSQPAGAGAAAAGGAWFWLIAPFASLLALGFAFYFYKKMMEAPEGSDKMIEIARHVRQGAYAYLFRQYSVVTLVFVILLAILGFCAYKGVQNPFVPVA
ncbi:MAG: sodium/proton-translocating pyrophosphatase, partial [Planctomycetota bacterium]